MCDGFNTKVFNEDVGGRSEMLQQQASIGHVWEEEQVQSPSLQWRRMVKGEGEGYMYKRTIQQVILKDRIITLGGLRNWMVHVIC